MTARIEVVPAAPELWDDVQAVFGTRGGAHHCQCQRIRLGDGDWWHLSVEERAHHLREQLDAGTAGAPGLTSGALLAYVDGEPAGWVAVAPRTEFVRYRGSQVPWAGRHEDKDDGGVWAVTCFAVRAGYRKQGLMYELAAAAVAHARASGAEAVEGYPIVPGPGQEIAWGEVNVGTPGPFAAAGLTEVSRPTKRRRVMRLDL
ncbi:GNAT family N-acetyltransferase [Promicromonospora thailandica]|uniref:Acetyltransferase (GNAT) family protein n=1 Tax=Promicromonospora thailandica TaxID=765201 RepID=A0A9X2G1W8_9MICO|nr:GNAT family N-acetyltransferase [Promicromonospora thailandica]MCP2263908.1 Acetyltransferase (GNAT) family protein [Promicromonospora thailandica]BFF17779.1 GNAT family N-acetyltransferase [Promicromonospora thailandica]